MRQRDTSSSSTEGFLCLCTKITYRFIFVHKRCTSSSSTEIILYLCTKITYRIIFVQKMYERRSLHARSRGSDARETYGVPCTACACTLRLRASYDCARYWHAMTMPTHARIPALLPLSLPFPALSLHYLFHPVCSIVSSMLPSLCASCVCVQERMQRTTRSSTQQTQQSNSFGVFSTALSNWDGPCIQSKC